MRKLAPMILSLSLLAGCHNPPGISTGGAASLAPMLAAAPAPMRAAAPLEGRAWFDRRAAQADLSAVATDATVSLIDAGTGKTVATTLTDAQGDFVMAFAQGFAADPQTTYYLEAIKGLNGNLPGHSAVRVRTLVRYDNGWTSLTSKTPNASVVVNPSTTALAVGAALRNHAAPYPIENLIGTLGGASHDQFGGLGALSAQDFTDLRTLVGDILAGNQDPIRNIGLYGTSTWGRLNQALAATAYTEGETWPGGSNTLLGTGFDLDPTRTTLRVNGVQASASVVSPTAIRFQMPELAMPIQASTSVLATLQVGQTTLLAPSLTVVPGVSLAAGKNGGYTYEGDGGPAVDAAFYGVTGLALDQAGNLYIADTGNGRIRKVEKSTGTITTLVSGLTYPTDVEVEPDGNFLIADTDMTTANGLVKRWNKTTGSLTVVAGGGTERGLSGNAAYTGPATDTTLRYPKAIALDHLGNLFIAHQSLVRRVDLTTGTISTIASGLLNTNGVTVDRAGNVYFSESTHHVKRWDKVTGVVSIYAGGGSPASGFGDGGLATDAKFDSPKGLVMDPEDNLFIAEYYNDANPQGRIRRVDRMTGIISSVVGGPGPVQNMPKAGVFARASTLTTYRPEGIAMAPDGSLFFSSATQQVARVR